MLSSAKIGRSSWRYYQRTVAGGACEYYTEHGDTPGRWHGHGLPDLGLHAGAMVAERELEALFGRAMSPTTGRQLGAGWGERSVTGYDLTFSAPKSVSALWALGDPKIVGEIEAAHTAAVHAALGYLEQVAGWSRRGRNGVDQVASAGYAAALFDHGTSRAGDPQLHTHALVVNKVRCTDDGVWRTLDGHEIYHHKKAAGAAYQAALRTELATRLHATFGSVSEHGQAEITGFPAELVQAWSTRTSAVMAEAVPTIAEVEEALGRPVSVDERARIIKTAVLATRPVKEYHAADPDRRTTWQRQAATLGWDRQRLTAAVTGTAELAGPVIAPAGGVVDDTATPAGRLDRTELLREAVTAVGRRKSVWSRADLTVAVAARVGRLAEVLPSSASSMTTLIDDLVDKALAGGQHPGRPAMTNPVGVVALGPDRAGDTARASDDRHASAELVTLESRIIDRALRGVRTPPHPPRDAAGRIHHLLAGPGGPGGVQLSQEQQQAAAALVCAADRVAVMTAPAGAGKTTTLAAAVRVWRATGTQVTLLAPSARAAAELTQASGGGPAGQTVARWLLTQNRTAQASGPLEALTQPPGVSTQPAVVLVDEASMLNTADLFQILTHATAQGARVVLVGDPAQIGAVNAPGGMFAHLTQVLAGRRIDLTGLHRFTHPWEAQASLGLRRGDPAALLPYLEQQRIHPEGDGHDAADAVFARWQEAVEDGRDALMLAQSWSDVNALNTRARAAAIATGAIQGPDLAVVPSCTASTRGHTELRSFRAGDVLIAKRNTPDIRMGDRALRNGDRLRVVDATDAGLRVQSLDDAELAVLPTPYLARHVEYGWASTVDGAQGATSDISILLARTGLDREHLYVAMTRGRQENHVHTTTALDTGDAGPHHAKPILSLVAPSRIGSDHAVALSLLARALVTSGSGQAAHALLAGNTPPPRLDRDPKSGWRSSDRGPRRDSSRVMSI